MPEQAGSKQAEKLLQQGQNHWAEEAPVCAGEKLDHGRARPESRAKGE